MELVQIYSNIYINQTGVFWEKEELTLNMKAIKPANVTKKGQSLSLTVNLNRHEISTKKHNLRID